MLLELKAIIGVYMFFPQDNPNPITTTPFLSMRYMDEIDLIEVMGWCREEGWNVGSYDASIYHRFDPKGHFLFLVNDRPIGAISIIRHSKNFFTIGPFIVKKEYRSQGYGAQIWQKAMKIVEQKNSNYTMALYSVPTQVGRYQKEGFNTEFANQGWQLLKTHESPRTVPSLSECLPIGEDIIPDVSRYDQAIFSVSRTKLLQEVLKLSRVSGIFLKNEKQITGFGIIRPCNNGCRVGPLFADTVENAKKLFLCLFETIDEGKIIIDIPKQNKYAILFAEYFGLTPLSQGETFTMFKGEVPEPLIKNIDKNYGVFSLEIG